MFRSSQQTAAVSNKQIFPAPVQEAVFSFSNFLSNLSIQSHWGHGDHPGDRTGGQHPCLDGSRLWCNFFRQKETKGFLHCSFKSGAFHVLKGISQNIFFANIFLFGANSQNLFRIQ